MEKPCTPALLGIKVKDSISWNTVIHGHLYHGHLEGGLCFFMQARVSGFEPNVSTLVLVAQSYRYLGYFVDGQKFHGFMIKNGFCAVTSVQNSLLHMYADVDMADAHKLFDEMSERDVISWSVMIGGYTHSEEAVLALEVYYNMVSTMGGQPDGLTMVSVLKACSSVGDMELGRSIHGSVVYRGLECDIFIGNSLIDMYSKCSDVDSSRKVFKEMPIKNNVSWNSIISGLVRNGMHQDALEIFDSMKRVGVVVDEVIFANLLQVYKHFCELSQCKSIHGRMIRLSYESNALLLSALMDAYANCNSIELAWKLFSRMKKRNMASWGVMISGFASSGMPDEAIDIFREMNLVGERPNAVVILNLIEGCAVSADLRRSKWAHGIALRRGLASEVDVGTAVLDMYSKCGALEASLKVFDQINQKNVMSWSAMIAAYAMNGQAREALNILSEMTQAGLKPNAITALSVLSACSHGGLVTEGLSFLKEMTQSHGIQPGLEHYSCVVDLLSRAGKLESAIDLVEVMPEKLKDSASLWGAILSACRRYRNSQIGTGAISRVLELEPSNSAGYLLASSLHAAGGSWDAAARMRSLVKEKNVKVISGYSMVYIDGRAYMFVAGDNNPNTADSGNVVNQLHRCMKMHKHKNGQNNDVVVE